MSHVFFQLFRPHTLTSDLLPLFRSQFTCNPPRSVLFTVKYVQCVCFSTSTTSKPHQYFSLKDCSIPFLPAPIMDLDSFLSSALQVEVSSLPWSSHSCAFSSHLYYDAEALFWHKSPLMTWPTAIKFTSSHFSLITMCFWLRVFALAASSAWNTLRTSDILTLSLLFSAWSKCSHTRQPYTDCPTWNNQLPFLLLSLLPYPADIFIIVYIVGIRIF